MERLLEVCLVGLIVCGGLACPVAAGGSQNGGRQALQAGIHVQLPVTRSAVAMPEADQAGALVLSITEDGRVYAGVTAVDPAVLADKLKIIGPGEKLFLKGDVHTAYGNVEKVLGALRTAGYGEVKVLTDQRESPQSGKLVHPKGLEVLLGSPATASAPTVIELVSSGKGRGTVNIGSERIAWGSLAGRLKGALRGRTEVAVRARGPVSFGEVVEVVDVCRSTGAQVILGQ